MKIAFVFPGQGSQLVGMGKSLYDAVPDVKRLFDEAGEALGYDMAELCFKGPESELNLTRKTQPALVTVSTAAALMLRAEGVEPQAVAGHSLGEYSALVASGAMSFVNAVRTTEYRGTVMQEAVPEGLGMMAAVLGLDRQIVEEVCADVAAGYAAPVNYNCPGQIVISGEKLAVEEALLTLKERGAKRVMPLPVSVPSHCRLMEGAGELLKQHLSSISMSDASVPVVPNADATFVTKAAALRDALVRQISRPVLWEDSIALLAAEGFDTFVEVGPGKVLAGLIKRCAKDATVLNVSDAESLQKALSELKC